MLRNLFRFTFMTLGGSKTISFELLAKVCQLAGLDDFTTVDAECIAQSLIDQVHFLYKNKTRLFY